MEACPDGWHLPSDSEWTQLTDYLGGIDMGNNLGIDEIAIAGGKLKETDTTHRASPNKGATNESGFTALPGGLPLRFAWFGIGYSGHWWSGTDNDTYSLDPWGRYMDSQSSNVYRLRISKSLGCSVRCVKD